MTISQSYTNVHFLNHIERSKNLKHWQKRYSGAITEENIESVLQNNNGYVTDSLISKSTIFYFFISYFFEVAEEDHHKSVKRFSTKELQKLSQRRQSFHSARRLRRIEMKRLEMGDMVSISLANFKKPIYTIN